MKRVVIVGGGVIGLCVAYYCAARGHKVTVIDQVAEDHEGCSYGNAGMVAPSHFVPLAAPGMVALGLKWMWNPESPFYVRPRFDPGLWSWGLKFWRAATPEHVKRSAPLLRDLSYASRACFEDLAKIFDFGLVQKGLLMLCKTEHAFEEEAKFAVEAHRLGVPAEVLNPKQAAALEPNVTMDIAGAVYFPKDCHLAPGSFMAGLKKRLQEMGAVFLWQTNLDSFVYEGARVQAARTTTHDIEGDEFVIAGGSWSPRIAHQLGLNIPMQAGKGYSLTLPNPRQLPKICAIFHEARVAVTPIGSSLRFGGTMEIAGLNEEINVRRVLGIIKSVPKYYPEFEARDFRDVKPWCGLRPCSPDGLPYIGRAKRYANVSIATGHAMLGLSLGPITGKLVAEIISEEKPEIEITLLDPDRYGRGWKNFFREALIRVGETHP